MGILQNTFRALKEPALKAGRKDLHEIFHNISYTFESARLAGWVAKFYWDVRGVQVMLRTRKISLLVSTLSAPARSKLVHRLLILSRTSMGIRWFIEQIRLAARFKILPEAHMEQSDQLWNQRAKYFWVGNCAFGFLAEAVRLMLFARGEKPGGTHAHAWISLLFYFFDCHASVHLTELLPRAFNRPNLGDGYVGTMMVIASLFQWYACYPTQPLALQRALGPKQD